jgi:hypothetical protein
MSVLVGKRAPDFVAPVASTKGVASYLSEHSEVL